MRVRLNHRRLREELARSRLSQNHWARRLGLDKGHFSQLVNGKRLYPAAGTRRKLLEGLGLRFDDLFTIERDAPATPAPPATRSRARLRPRPAGTDFSRPGLPRLQGESPMNGMLADLKLAWCTLSRSPLFSVVTILVLALGVGANSAIFSVVKGVVLDPLPYPESDRLVVVWENDRHRGTQREGASIPDFLDFRERARLFQQLAARQLVNRTLTGRSEPLRLVGSKVTANFLPALGVTPVLGRHFTEEDETPGRDRVLLLHHALWQSAFGGDPGVVGQSVVLDGEPHTIVGVMPPAARMPTSGEQLWVPYAITEDEMIRGRHNLLVVGRLLPGVPLARAQEEMTAIMAALEQEYPEDNQARGAFVAPLHPEVVGNVRPALLLILGAVACVLLIVCVNIANLLLSRGAARQAEIALRRALGASRTRIVRQMMTESFVLTVAGFACGLALAWAGTRLLLQFVPSSLPRLDNVALDGPVTLFTLGLSLLTWLVFGLVPAVRASGSDVQQTLKEGGRGASEGSARQRLKKTLVVAEVALAVVLVIGAGLVLRSFWGLSRVDPGLEPVNALSLDLELPGVKYPAPEDWPFLVWPRVTQLQDRLIEEVEALPGVRAAAVGLSNPLSGAWTTRTRVVGKPIPEQSGRDEAYFQPVSENYFQACGIPLRKGRFFTRADDDAHPLVAIVNEAFAAFYFGEDEPLGERILIYGREREIVGVVGDVRFRGLGQESYPAMYLPFRQNPMGSLSLVYRSETDPAGLLAAVKSLIWRIDPDLAVFTVAPLDEALSASLGRQRFTMVMLLCFAFSALLLSAVGVYGVISYLVAQRRHEIGIRMALGASRGEVFRLVVGAGMILVAIGVGVGLATALGSAGLVASLLYGISSRDPLTFAAVPLLLALVAFLACYLPARRASRADPMSALRYE